VFPSTTNLEAPGPLPASGGQPCHPPTTTFRNEEPDYLLSTRQSCENLGVSRTTLYEWVRDGLITPTRLGPRILRFDIADFDALLS
jgi:excisionase family DNA binding protein